jgi:hypothetical protein
MAGDLRRISAHHGENSALNGVAWPGLAENTWRRLACLANGVCNGQRPDSAYRIIWRDSCVSFTALMKINRHRKWRQKRKT